jgi:hypothetical protein
MRQRWPLVFMILLVLAGAASAQAMYKNTKLGFSFKPPKDFKAIPVDPTEHIVLVKYQASQTEYGTAGGYNSMVRLQYYPKKKLVLSGSDDAGGEDPDDDEGATDETPADPLTARVNRLKDEVFTKFTCTRDKTLKVGGAPATELNFESEEAGLAFYCLVLDQEDGIFVYEGSALADRFDKLAGEFASSAKSFKRIDRVEDRAKTEKMSQMSEQDRFLQEQIDKLPPGWGHMRTKRYLFLYSADKGFVQVLADRIEAMRDQYERDYPPDHEITAVSIVRVCGSDDEYHGYGGPQNTGGYWNWVDRELVVFDYPPREFTLAVINHEAFHQYIYYFYGQLSPHSWYNEGTGDYYAGAKLTKSNRIQSFGEAPGGIGRTQNIKEGARLLAEGKPKGAGAACPPKELMKFHQQEYYGGAGYPPGLCYAEGWALVSFLRQGKGLEPAWQKVLPDYLVNLLAARHQVATQLMDKAIAKWEKAKADFAAKNDEAPDEVPPEPSRDAKDYYFEASTSKENDVQDVAYSKTFGDWTDADWDRFQQAFLKYVEKL